MQYDCILLQDAPVSLVGLHTDCIIRIFGLEFGGLRMGMFFRGENVTEGCGDGITTGVVVRNS